MMPPEKDLTQRRKGAKTQRIERSWFWFCCDGYCFEELEGCAIGRFLWIEKGGGWSGAFGEQ
jgi:hypothetical protein